MTKRNARIVSSTGRGVEIFSRVVAARPSQADSHADETSSVGLKSGTSFQADQAEGAARGSEGPCEPGGASPERGRSEPAVADV